jgi:hypothetical protein
MNAKTDGVMAKDMQGLSRGSPSFSSDDEVSELFVCPTAQHFPSSPIYME